jgi:hypothetical protein
MKTIAALCMPIKMPLLIIINTCGWGEEGEDASSHMRDKRVSNLTDE